MARDKIVLPITGVRSEIVALRLGKDNVAGYKNVNGNVEIDLYGTDSNALKFQANIKMFGAVAEDTFTFTPCNDTGAVITFGAVDDVINWINSAYVELVDVKIHVKQFTELNTNVTIVKDPVKEKLAKKARFQKLVENVTPRLATATEDELAAKALGWDVSPFAAYTLQYANVLAKKNALTAMKAYYQERVTFYSA